MSYGTHKGDFVAAAILVAILAFLLVLLVRRNLSDPVRVRPACLSWREMNPAGLFEAEP